MLVPKTQHLPTLNYVYGGLAVFCEFVAIVCVTRWVGKRREKEGTGGWRDNKVKSNVPRKISMHVT